MLNENQVLEYIKTKLGYPFQKIEIDDNAISNFLQQYTIRSFSKYIPDTNKINLDFSDNNKVDNTQNEFYIDEPDNREILSISEIYLPQSYHTIMGHPFIGPLTWSKSGLEEWALAVEKYGMLKMMGSWEVTYEFKHPNIIRLSPVPTALDFEFIIVEYERVHSPDFSSIPNEYINLFLDYCLGDISENILNIRKKYSGGTLRTPFGEIPLEVDTLQEYRDRKKELEERFSSNLIPNVIVDFG